MVASSRLFFKIFVKRGYDLALSIFAAAVLLSSCGERVAPVGYVEIDVRVEGASLLVTWQLPEPVSKIEFESTSKEGNGSDWVLLSDHIEWEGAEIRSRSDATFQSFEIRVEPDTREYDRMYPTLWKVGDEGIVVHPPNFELKIDFPSSIRVEIPADHVAFGGFGVERSSGLILTSEQREWKNFLYVGEDIVETTERLQVVASKSFPGWLRRSAVEALKQSYEELESGFGQGLNFPITVILVWHPDAEHSGWRGHVAGLGSMGLRFKGSAWGEDSPSSGRQINKFVAHEVFHLWGSGVYDTSVNHEEPWLHEGMAEYYAILASQESAGEGRKSVAQAISRCAAKSGSKPFLELGKIKGSAPYDCGVFFQWISSYLVSIEAIATASDYLSVLDDVLRNGASDDGHYSPETFFEYLGRRPQSDANEILTNIVFATDDKKWNRLGVWLKNKGLGIRQAEGASAAASDFGFAIFHILRGQCPDGVSRGFWTVDDRIRLQALDGCAPGLNLLEVSHIEGFHVISEKADVVNAIVGRCEAKQPVRLHHFATSDITEVACREPMRPFPVTFEAVN